MTDQSGKKTKGAAPMGKPEKFVWKVTIKAPIETVWSTLVKTDEVLPFFFGAVCQTKDGLKPGRKMRMASADGKFAVVFGEVKEFNPPHRYSHTMSFTQNEGEEPGWVGAPGCKGYDRGFETVRHENGRLARVYASGGRGLAFAQAFESPTNFCVERAQ